jgi:hypothetical protein
MTGFAFVRDTIRLEFQCRLGDEQTCIGLCAHRAIQAQLHTPLEALTTLVP